MDLIMFCVGPLFDGSSYHKLLYWIAPAFDDDVM
jgi:hypothetical protein